MKMRTPRTPAKVWIEALKKIIPILADCNVNDVILFGSQAMSAHMLASKDMDLIAPGVTINTLERLSNELVQVATRKPVYNHQVDDYEGRRYPVGHIYVKHKSGYPFVIELFETFMGYRATRLAPFLTFKEKWSLWLGAPTPEAIIGIRLAFRPPERITPTNAMRLNRFIRNIRRVDWSEVNTFIDTFNLRPLVLENLETLRSTHISITGSSKIIQL